MECSFGITGKGFSIIASDSNAARSIVKMKGDEDKMKVLSKHLVMAYNGESGEMIDQTNEWLASLLTKGIIFSSLYTGDTIQFAEYIERNMRLYGIR